VLYALGDPVSFLLLLAATVVALTLHGWVSALVTARTGDRSLGREGRLRPDPRRQIDPFGAIAALVGGAGWSARVRTPDRRRRGALLASCLAGAVVLLVVGAAALLAFSLLGRVAVGGGSAQLLRSGVSGLPLGQRALLLGGLVHLSDAVLSLVPLLPLAGGRLLFALAPRTRGWQQAEYQLGERNIGVAILLALSLLAPALLFTVLGAFVDPLARLLTGG